MLNVIGYGYVHLINKEDTKYEFHTQIYLNAI